MYGVTCLEGGRKELRNYIILVWSWSRQVFKAPQRSLLLQSLVSLAAGSVNVVKSSQHSLQGSRTICVCVYIGDHDLVLL